MQMIFPFGVGVEAPDIPTDSIRPMLGGKGAGLCEMAAIALPVPPGFTITTAVCSEYYRADNRLPPALLSDIDKALRHIEQGTERKFGNADNPLLLSVRSGAQVSMPGMMDTVLNLGLNDSTVLGLAKASADARFAWDSYRRFIHMYATVVIGLDHDEFEEMLEIAKEERGYMLDTDMQAEDWQALVADYKQLVLEQSGAEFPQDTTAQLHAAIAAVFASWQSDRAQAYRQINNIPEDWGTAVTVQAMVFGNMGETSATGVAFTRDPSSGERVLFGEWLVNAQGEDIVAGIRTPNYLTKAAREKAQSVQPSLEEAMPDTFAELTKTFATLEQHYRDMQDMEFTIERGRLWMLQTRSGKRTAKAALKIAVDMVSEGLISEQEAILRVEPAALDQLLHPQLDPTAPRSLFAKGLPASPGAASGRVMLDAASAERAANDGAAVILARMETSPEDIRGMHASQGIVTARGGMTSHAAVVARGMGRPCVSGAGSVTIDLSRRIIRAGGQEIREGDVVTIDGSTGEVFVGEIATMQPELSNDFRVLMGWADKIRRMQVRTNAETIKDVTIAREFGAEGIGLCRTEHMFFDAERIMHVRAMILAKDENDRQAALTQLLPAQRTDFELLFSAMDGLPVTIRLLDPPLHEFLPSTAEDIAALAASLGIDADKLRARSEALHEVNPMLGHRGCRLAISYPQIYAMQARAIFEAACNVAAQGIDAQPEVMIPLIISARELSILRALVDETAAAVFAEKDCRIAYKVGTMIELPRAALCAGEIAQGADFFSFGTNDLTQTTNGISRDDSGRFLPDYLDKAIFASDPFVSIDREGVGALVELASERARAVCADLKMGICGEHGGDPASIDFCEQIALDYVSASPYRVPIARLAAAQASLNRLNQ